MRRHTAKPIQRIAGILGCIALVLVTLPADARSEYNRSINLAARQWLLVEQMTNGTMLAALGIDTEQNIRNVAQARDLFDRTLIGLRSGDAELGLVAASEHDVISEIARVEAFWPRYDQMIQSVIASLQDPSGVREAQIRELANVHRVMIESVERTTAAFEEFSHGGGTHSILTTTLNGSVQLRSHTQQMLGEMLAIAFHENEEQNRRLLGQATREFDRTLNGLIYGDPEMRLLPAANDEIRAELAKVQRLWSEIQPILAGVAVGATVDQRSITTVSRYAARMIAPLNMTSLMYENL